MAPRTTQSWQCRMCWQALAYGETDSWLSLQIEPMKHGACRAYVPGEKAWAADAPPWAQTHRSVILARLRQVAWNRDLEWVESETTPFWHLSVTSPVPGSIESTLGGQQLERMWVFHPDNPGR